MTRTTLAASALALATLLPTAHAQKFICGTKSGYTSLTTASAYTEATPGFDLSTTPAVSQGSCSSDKPFFFSATVPEGSYRVTVVLGSDQASITTVWAEARRLMLEKISTQPNASAKHTFDVNVRYPEFTDAVGTVQHVHLKPRERNGNMDWDHKLTLEFNGDNPSVRSITIEPIKKEPTIYIAGDSTVVDQDVEPWTAWGQILPRFLRPGVVVANHAESGETIKSFVSERRFDKIFTQIKSGDYLFMQFNHNDQKINPKTGQPVVPIDEYKSLLTEYIAKARAAGATPVLVTSMNRRTFDASGHITNSLAGYPDAMREVAREQHAALIDLNAMSKTLFEAMGPEGSKKAFMHFPANAYPNQTQAISDDTHFNSYGAYELARCIVDGIRQNNLPLKKYLTKDAVAFNPAHPDSQPDFHLPATPIPATTHDVMKVPQT
ncbi:rhamnogalacturonan acetylesterase [Edaphobacter dinghuensis]|uniref:Rhamnogalacturonan acetylesterase n=1 Tax=Edaphobacter dinghuensis TaxID=1560005 RepID=A0A917M497_9BACT|nr:rhamnogalacturonan acetylesterase [Edaphobacter dinghuensis]GGG74564.1 rhamnogalacturonan acetylesterase [Edaphobacter dinghuensis]